MPKCIKGPETLYEETFWQDFEYYTCFPIKAIRCESEIDTLDLESLTFKDIVFNLIEMLVKSRDEGQDKMIDLKYDILVLKAILRRRKN